MKKSGLKKTLCVILAALTALFACVSLSACNDNKNPNKDDKPTEVTVPVYNTTGQTQKAAIILPGILGSNLIDRETGDAVWSAGSFIGNIAMNSDVISDKGFNLSFFEAYLASFLKRDAKGDFAKAKVGAANMKDDNLQFGIMNSYESLYNLVNDTIGEKTDFGYHVAVFQYDWRNSCTDSAADLAQFIEKNKYEDVILIGHSMGGLVIDYYLAASEANRANTEAVITLSTPHLGAVDSPAILLGNIMPTAFSLVSSDILESMLSELGDSIPEGYDSITDFAAALADVLNSMSRTLPSTFELFPNEELTQSGIYALSSLYTVDGAACDYDSLTENILLAPWAGENAYITSVVQKLKAKQQSLYINGVFVSDLVNTYYFAGSGFDTTKSLAFKLDNKNDFAYKSFTSTKEGDMLVLEISSAAGNSLDADNVSVFEDMNHMDIIAMFDLKVSDEVGGSREYIINNVGLKLKGVLEEIMTERD